MSTLSSAVVVKPSSGSCRSTPMCRASVRRARSASGAPSKLTTPAAAARKPASVCRVNVFPEPFLPRMATNSRGANVADRSTTSARVPAVTPSACVVKRAPAVALFDIALGLQAGNGPGPGLEPLRGVWGELARPEVSIVDAGLALLPKLNVFGPETIAAPMRRTGNGVIPAILCQISGIRRAEAPRGRGHSCDERGARTDAPALCARPGGKAARPGTRREVGIALGGRRAHDRSSDANLSLQLIPVHDGGRARGFRKLRPLP